MGSLDMAGRSTIVEDSPATDEEATINPWLQSHCSGWINMDQGSLQLGFPSLIWFFSIAMEKMNLLI